MALYESQTVTLGKIGKINVLFPISVRIDIGVTDGLGITLLLFDHLDLMFPDFF